MNIALVTGTTKGIGYSVAEQLMQNNFLILALARNRERLDAMQSALGSERLETYTCDVTDPDQVSRTFEDIGRKHARIDLLINNAGVGYFESLQSTTRVHWEDTIRTNLSGPFYVTQRCLPFLRKSERPHIINICSTASRKGFPNCSAYAASKFGLYGMTEVWREELRSEGIRVTAVIPGPVNTPFWQSFQHSFDTARMIAPEQVARAILWIAGQSSGSVIDEITLKPVTGDL